MSSHTLIICRISLFYIFCILLGPLSVEFFIPGIMLMAKDLQVNPEQARLALILFPLGFGTAQLLYGYLADRIRPQKILVWTLVLYCLASLGCSFASKLHHVLLLRVLQSIGASGPLIIGRVLMITSLEKHKYGQILSFMGAAGSLCAVCLPLLSSAMLHSLSWRALFGMMACMSMLTMGFHALAKNALIQQNITPSSSLENWLNKNFFMNGAIAVLFYSGIFVFLTKFHDLCNVPHCHLYFSGIIFCYALGQYSSGYWVRKYIPTDRLKIVGIGLSLFSAILLLLGSAVLGRILSFAIFALAAGTLVPLTVTEALSNNKKTGLATGLLGFSQMGVAALTAGLLNSFQEVSIALLFIFISSTCFLLYKYGRVPCRIAA